MTRKRILTIQDISCVGQCSMTVALPVLAAWGHEVSALPTMVLSAHTGGFGTPAVIRLEDRLEEFWRHWQSRGISFDCILTGYLGSAAAVKAAEDILDRFLAPGGIAVVDPAMADNGRLYAGLDEGYPSAVAALCRRGDILLPNLTECALLAGEEYREAPTQEELARMLDKLGHPNVVVTGLEAEDGEAKILWRQGRAMREFRHGRVPGSFAGTGDLFAACFTGALARGIRQEEAISLAGMLTEKCIRRTQATAPGYGGIHTAAILPDICRLAEKEL